jgi:hypothetical protein
MAKTHIYEVRFRVNRKPKSFKTRARSPEEAIQRLRSAGTIIRVTKIR